MATVHSLNRAEETSTIAPNVKLGEARTAVLLKKNVPLNNRSELTMWILEHMFQPVTTAQEYDGYQLLHLSASSKPCWERRKKEPYQTHSNTGTNDPSETPNPTVAIPTISLPEMDNKSPEKMYLVTPRTRILTISKEHCMVFMIDLSSSLATIETSTGKVMLGNAFSVLENIIQGLVQPYTVQLSDNVSPFTVETDIRITVIAECSQFGSNINVIPILAEYPTLRVLMQNISVSSSNVNDVLCSLRESIDNFKRDLSKFRKELRSKRAKMGYELDVREYHTQSVTEGVEPAFTRSSLRQKTSGKSTATTKGEEAASTKSSGTQTQPQGQSYKKNKTLTSKQPFKKLEVSSSSSSPKKSLTGSPTSQHRYHKRSPSFNNSNSNSTNNAVNVNQLNRPVLKDKKDTWGVGKSGSTLSYILRAGLLALSVLSRDEQASIFLLTDGVVKSNVQDETVIRQLTAENIWCNVIQLGQDRAFFPGLNFGFVPDNEILDFLATSTLGHFTFAEHCPVIKPSTADKAAVEGDNSSNDQPAPNVYHQRYLLKEVSLDYLNQIRANRKIREDGTSAQTHPHNQELVDVNNAISFTSMPFESAPHFGRRAFPWDPLAKPVLEELGRLKFKEYSLPTECYHFMRARLRQGFILQSVSFIDEPKASLNNNKATNASGIHKSQQQTLSVEGISNLQKKQYVIMIFILRWQPNITVQYSIKALWTSSLQYQLRSLTASPENAANISMDTSTTVESEQFFECIRNPKVEIVIKSTSTFAHMLHNWDSFQRRTQMMAVQGGNATVDLASAPGFVKVGKMKRFLERLAETDGMLKQLVQFSITEKSNNASSLIQPAKGNQDANTNLEWQHHSTYVQRFSSHWAKLERSDLRVFNSCWYDEKGFNIILAETNESATSHKRDISSHDDSEHSASLSLAANINRAAIQSAFNQVQDNLKEWATFVSEDQQVYIKLTNIDQIAMIRRDTAPDGGQATNDNFIQNIRFASSSSPRKHSVPQFCEVRLMRETERLLYVKLMFFNLTVSQRKELEKKVRDLLVASAPISLDLEEHVHSQETSPDLSASPIYTSNFSSKAGISLKMTKRPLSTLLMRDASHHTAFSLADIDTAKSPPQGIRSLWISNPAMLLTGEFIVKNYLQHCTWIWDVQDIQHDQYGYGRAFTSVMDLTFDHIVAARLKEGWSLLSISRSSAHFYIEANGDDDESQPAYSAQYFIWKDTQKKRSTTELWIEPTSDEKTYKMHEFIKKETLAADKRIISQLITFDIIFLFGQNYSASIDDILAVRMDDEDESRASTVWMHRSTLFDIFSIFQIGSFLFVVYSCPYFERHFHPEEAKTTTTDSYPNENHQHGMLAGEVIRQRNELVFGTSELSQHSRVTFGLPLENSTTMVKPPAIYQADMTSTCICSRPDKLFSAEKDQISKLSSTLRDMALLHYYVEKSLSLITDRTIPLPKMSTEEFWPSLMKELFQGSSIDAKGCAASITQNFRDYHCFVKIFQPSICMIILCPQLKTVVKGLSKLSDSDSASGEVLLSKLGLMIFECRRQNTVARFNDSSKVDQINISPVDPLQLNGLFKNVSTSLQPNVLAASFNGIANEEARTDQSMHLLREITDIYSRCYVKSIFSCLLHGRAVDSNDFERVLEVCNETNIDIDLTGYLNVQTMLRRQSSIKEEDISEVYQRFTAVLGHYFEPVIISNGKWSNIYCYRPPFAKIGQKLGLSLSSGEKPTDLADVVMCAQTPLFVRLNCTLRKPDSSEKGFTEVQFPLYQLPMSFKGKLEDGTEYNFEPESIGTDLSPVESTDKTTATLHLVCITLPPCKYDVVNTEFVHESVCPIDSSAQHQDFPLHVVKDKQTKIQGLSKDKLDALLETEARLNWLFSEEIIHGLLRIEPVTENMIHYVEAQLQKKNSFVDFPTTTFIPLAFVKSQKESRHIFLDELEAYSNTSYQLKRVGDCFYASDNNAAAADYFDHVHADTRDVSKNTEFFDGEGLNISTDSISEKECSSEDTEVTDIKEESNDEFCHGLGISIEDETANDIATLPTTLTDQPVRPRRYWLLIIPQAQTVQIYFYAKKQQFVNRTEIIRVTRSMINAVLERTNKMSLLRYLNETRKCSKYLLATAEEENSIYSSEDESTDEDEYINGANNNLVEILSTSGEDSAFSPPKKFSPGQFACDIVFTKRFPLHWRLAPNTAYNKLMTDVLQPFLVKNVPGMFVCSHDTSVLYCFLSETSVPAHNNMSESTNLSLSVTSIGDERYHASHPESPFGIFANVGSSNDAELLSNTHSRNRHTTSVEGKSSPQGSAHSERQSPRQSPNPAADTTTAASISSPISSRKINQRNQDGRELVLEVHGVRMNHYIVDGLVDMIESRITSDITLKEVQQFLIRNPNSKLSRADVDFILPVEKKPMVQRQFQLPSLIKNTAQFLKIFRRNILATSSLHSLQSNYLDDAVKRHYNLRYTKTDKSKTDRVLKESDIEGGIEEWTHVDLCFYYNFINRAPGTSLSFEQKIGEGIAGICLAIVDNEGNAYSQVSSSAQNHWRDYDTQSLHNCLTTDFENNTSQDNIRIAVDIWTHCKIDVGQIYWHVYRSFRQTICDYIIETSILSITSTDSNAEDEFASMAHLLTFTLKIAAEWESSTVKHILQPIQLAPWYLEGISLQLRTELVDIHASLEPIIARAKQPSTLRLDDEDRIRPDYYEIYSFDEKNTKAIANRKNLQSKYSNRGSMQNYPNTRTALLSQYVKSRKKLLNVPTFDNANHKYLLLSGLPELLSKYNLYSSTSVRNSSIDAGIESNDRLSALQGTQQHSDWVTGPNSTPNASETARKDDNNSLHSRQESLASSISRALPSYVSKQRTVSLREPLHQHSFVIFLIDSHELRTFAYNCSNQFIDFVYQAMCRNVMQQESRHMGLNNILNQKLGLFYHSKKMADVISIYQEETNDLLAPTFSSHAPATPLIHNSGSQIQLLNNSNSRIPMSPIIANTFDRLVQLDSVSSVPSFDSMSNDKKSKRDKHYAFGFEQLQQLITDSFQYKRRAQIKQHQSVLEVHDNAKLCRTNESDKVLSPVKGADANTLLHDVFADSVEENTNWYDNDYLIRHGEPYLKMYLARSKPLAAHEKAFKVYMKWAHKYYGPTSQPSINNNEMMTVSELRQILKASRLLHFCRTPLIFSSLDLATALTIAEPSFMTQHNTAGETGGRSSAREKPKIPKSDEMTKWYASLADNFLREYAAYLESIGMHLIVYGPSNQDQDEIDAYLSDFTITEDYTVKSPVVYLLQVFEGGSIMCEIRLTGAFVSVTLYTLHRRYGRLQYSPFSYPQKREEIGRENFQLFMSESDRFKHRIHVNSFVYDFHLRYIQRSLDNIDSLPQNLDLLGILKSTVAIYNRPAIFARNRIMSGNYVFEVDEVLADIVPWIMKSGKVLGLKTLQLDGTPVSCFISSNEIDLDSKDADNTNSLFRYTLILCSDDDKLDSRTNDMADTYQQGSFDMKGTLIPQEAISNIKGTKNEEGSSNTLEIYLKYFILVTYRGMEREGSPRKTWATVLKDTPATRSSRTSADQIATPDDTAVKEAARHKIEDIITNAMYHYHREMDWNRLCEVMRPHHLKESAETIARVATRFSPIDLGEADETFAKFLKMRGVNWDDALDNLKLFYLMTSGEVAIADTRHVFLFNNDVASHTFFHFTHTHNGQCQITFNCKGDRGATDSFTEDERQSITKLATCLSYYIWRRLK